jgi:hypothetical protein
MWYFIAEHHTLTLVLFNEDPDSIWYDKKNSKPNFCAVKQKPRVYVSVKTSLGE